jgi:hypothetical protein
MLIIFEPCAESIVEALNNWKVPLLQPKMSNHIPKASINSLIPSPLNLLL